MTLRKVQVTLDSITVRWEAPQRLPEEATEISYTLAYAFAYEEGHFGNFVEVENLKDTTTVIDGLAMDTLYAFKAKVKYRNAENRNTETEIQKTERQYVMQVLTNEGTSEFSRELTIKTMSNQTDLGRFEDQVMGKFYFSDIPQDNFIAFRCSKWPERRSSEEVNLLFFQSFVRC